MVPGVEAIPGGSVPDDVHLDDAWPQRVHPDDYDTYATAMGRIHGGEPGISSTGWSATTASRA